MTEQSAEKAVSHCVRGRDRANDGERRYGLRQILAEHPSQLETQGWWPVAPGFEVEGRVVDVSAATPCSVTTRRAWEDVSTGGQGER